MAKEVAPGLLLLDPANDADLHRFANIGNSLARFPVLFDDSVRLDPIGWFLVNFGNRNNLVFDVGDGAGVIAFIHTVPKWRASMYVAGWRPEGLRRDDLWRTAAQFAVLYHDLLVLDAFVAEENRIAQRAALRNGLRFRGRLREAVCYSGRWSDLLWYEATREEILNNARSQVATA